MMEGWSDWEREEFWRMMRELDRQVNTAMRDDIAGLKPRDPKMIDSFRSHENIELDGRVYGTLISDANAREMEAIRVDALTASDVEDAMGDVTVVLLRRIVDVLGRVFVTVDPPHTSVGSETLEHLPIEIVMHAFTLAFVRRPTLEHEA